MQVTIGRHYYYRPVGLDRFAPLKDAPAVGQRVCAIKSPSGCPAFGVMGHCYVTSSATGDFIGLVRMASLSSE